MRERPGPEQEGLAAGKVLCSLLRPSFHIFPAPRNGLPVSQVVALRLHVAVGEEAREDGESGHGSGESQAAKRRGSAGSLWSALLETVTQG